MDSDADNNDGNSSSVGDSLKCQVCRKVFKHKSSLSRHVGSKCGSAKSFECRICKKQFDRRDSLKRHIETSCSGPERKNTKCIKCSKDFQTPWHLQRHLFPCYQRCIICKKKISGNHDQHECNMFLVQNRVSLPEKRQRSLPTDSELQTSGTQNDKKVVVVPTEEKEFSIPEDDENLNTSVNDDSSPADYEYSLRVENIRLKSRLEQLKEEAASLERENVKKLGEIEHEKHLNKKANKTIFTLMEDKQKLEEELKRRSNSLHSEGIEEVVGKLENEIFVLEERLERQRKRYNNEHMMMYEDLRQEKRRQEDWKQMYFKSQIAVMSFRRRTDKIRFKISDEEYQALIKCLEIYEEDSIRKDIELLTSGNRPLLSKDISLKDAANHFDSLQREQHAITYKDHNSRRTGTPDSETAPPKVFIMDDENAVNENEHYDKHFSPKSSDSQNTKDATKPRHQAYPSNSYRRYHQQPSPNEQRTSSRDLRRFDHSRHDNAPHVKQYWHNYSTDNPPRKHNYEKPDIKLIKPSTYQNINLNDTHNDTVTLQPDAKFLELKFDNTFLKQPDIGSVQNRYKNKMPISKTPYSFHKYKGPSEEPQRTSHHHAPPGTLLEVKKLWCLKCEGDVTKNPCGHTSDIVVQEREKEFPCPTCKKIFNNRSHLKRHNMIHSGEKPYSCTYCEKRFNRKSHLNRHLLTHTGEKPFKCQTCGKGFADNSDLKRHKQIHEISPALTAISPKIQPIAPKPLSAVNATVSIPGSVPLSSSGTVSKDGVTSGGVEMSFTIKKKDNRFPCNTCGKFFTRKSHLTRHKLTHEQQKIYCDCGRMFRQKAHFQAHIPSCKRKRDLIEAKYKARHGIKQSQPTQVNLDRREEETFPITSNGINHQQETSNIKDNERRDIHTSNTASPVYTDQEREISPAVNVKIEEPSINEMEEDDLNLNPSKLPALPPLIKDPV